VTTDLAEAVRRFVDRLAPELIGLSTATPGLEPDRLRHDAVLEAFNVCAGLLTAGGRCSDDELWEVLRAFGPLLDTPLAGTTPAGLRESGLLTRQGDFTSRPSAMFEVLLTADATQGGARARAYYDAVLEIAYALAAADLHTSEKELDAIERYRAVLLDAITGNEASTRPTRQAPGTTGEPAPPAPPPDLPPARPLEELLAELDALIGMAGVKHEVRLVAALIRVQAIRRERGLPTLEQSRHLVFTGNPGTGKTTVARLLAQIYRTLGVVERGHLVEADRSSLVAGYVGQTAPKVVAAFDRADEGVLLIDEAYSLARGGENDFGREAIDTIVKLVEDRRDRIVVIMAGYPDEMDALVTANPGMRSRFPKSIHFPDYTTDELVQIFDMQAGAGHYQLDDAARTKLRRVLDAIPRDRGFGNGRLVRNLFEAAVAHQASRLVAGPDPTDAQLTTLVADDIIDPGHTPERG
jgi:Cdc6-like AAA superfamily ATPase